MFVQNFIGLSAAVHELSCVQRKKLGRKQYCPSLPRTAKMYSEAMLHAVGRTWLLDH